MVSSIRSRVSLEGVGTGGGGASASGPGSCPPGEAAGASSSQATAIPSRGPAENWDEFEPDEFDGADEADDGDDDWLGEQCGRWDQNAPGGKTHHCTLAGTEFCDFECPLRPERWS